VQGELIICTLFTTQNNQIGVVDVTDSSINQLNRSFFGHTLPVAEKVVWLPDNDCIFFSASEDCTVKLWDIREKKEVRVFQSEQKLFCVDYHDSNVYAGSIGSIFVSDISGKRLPSISEHIKNEKEVSQLMYHNNLNFLFSVIEDTVCLLDTKALEDDQLVDAFHTYQTVTDIGFFGPQDKYCWTICNWYCELSLWNLDHNFQGYCIFRFHSDNFRNQLSDICGVKVQQVIKLQYFNSQLLLYAGTSNNQIAIFEIFEDKIQHKMNLNMEGSLSSAEYLDLGESKIILTGTDSGRFSLWKEKYVLDENMEILSI